MKPRKQKNFHRPEEGLIGDCHRTCLAIMLDRERDDIPNFGEVGFNNEIPGGGNSKQFNEAVEKWLNEQGYSQVTVPFAGELEQIQKFMLMVNPGIRYILGGLSSTGVNHSVVGLDDEIFCDPSKNDSGIVAPCEPDGHYWLTFLIPINQKEPV